MPKIVRVAAIQAAPVGFDLGATLEKVRSLVQSATKSASATGVPNGEHDQHSNRPTVDLVVLPEAFVSAYPRHWGFAIGSRSDEQREWYGRYVRSSVIVPEDALSTDEYTGKGVEGDDCWAFGQLAAIAKENQVHLSIGVIERSPIGSTLWCTNLLFSPSGRLLSKHRKLQPTAAERVVWSQGEKDYPCALPQLPGADEEVLKESMNSRRGRGDNMPVVSTKIGRVGGLICWENFMPLARYVLYKKGVEIYTAPTADARPTWLPVMQHIAQEGRCYVISANQYHTSSDFPSDYPANVARAPGGEGEEVWSRGGSCVIGPLGEVLAGPLWDKEGILYADLDMDKLHGARLDFDPTGHYSREELLLSLLNDLH